MDFKDWRWKLLLCLALILIGAGVLGSRGILSPNPSEVTPKSWVEMDLRWVPEGPTGPGIYSHVDKARWSASTLGEGNRSAESLVDPRLAVFTFQPMDLNRVDYDTLLVLKGVGTKMATAIIAYRRDHGSFSEIEDLLTVKGVGPARFKVLRRNLAVQMPSVY